VHPGHKLTGLKEEEEEEEKKTEEEEMRWYDQRCVSQ
jgi:hypothetical protein